MTTEASAHAEPLESGAGGRRLSVAERANRHTRVVVRVRSFPARDEDTVSDEHTITVDGKCVPRFGGHRGRTLPTLDRLPFPRSGAEAPRE